MKKLCLGVAIILFFFLHADAKDKTVQNAELDLSGYDWQNGPVNLNGDWEFYWNKFYTPSFFSDSLPHAKYYAFVPSFWNDGIKDAKEVKHTFGFATYRVVVKCPPGNDQLALKFLTIESAYRVFINGREVLNIGHADTTADETIADLRPYILKVTPENNTLDIIIQVSNFHNRTGGLWDFVCIGTVDQLQNELIQGIALQCFTGGFFLLAAIYYLILFFSFKKRYTLLFFSLLCVVVSTRIFVTGEMPLLYISSANWEIARRLEYISLYLSVPLMCLFSYHLFPLDFSKKVLYAVLPLCGLFLLLAIFGTYYYYTYAVNYFELMILLSAFYGLYVYIRAALNKRPGSFLFLTGFLIFIAAIINDVLYANLMINSLPLFYAGVSAFVIMLSVILSRQFSQTFKELQSANLKMLETNNKLTEMHKEVSEKNRELKKINIEMDSLVNRTSHDLRAPLTSILGINRLAKEEMNNETLNEYLILQEDTLIRMDGLIKDIIDFSTNKREELELKEVDFSIIVENAIADHAYMYNAPGIEKNAEIDQYENFISDPRRISIIINNLISNAIKYADPSKEKQEINIRILVADNMATIEVSDNGIGIEEKHLEKIFTLFYRVSTNKPGSGLGLYIIKETVEKLSGYVIINSKKADGTTVKVMMPNIGYKL